jgi:hypothetical protein
VLRRPPYSRYEPRLLSEELLTAAETARRLGVTRATIYDWLGLSRRNLLEIHGRRVTIEFFQTGAKGQGRIRLEAMEVVRIKELLRVKPTTMLERRPPTRRQSFPHITVPLGRPDRRVGS